MAGLGKVGADQMSVTEQTAGQIRVAKIGPAEMAFPEVQILCLAGLDPQLVEIQTEEARIVEEALVETNRGMEDVTGPTGPGPVNADELALGETHLGKLAVWKLAQAQVAASKTAFNKPATTKLTVAEVAVRELAILEFDFVEHLLRHGQTVEMAREVDVVTGQRHERIPVVDSLFVFDTAIPRRTGGGVGLIR